MEFLHQLGTLDFWKTLLDGFGDLGPLAPIALAMVESFFPPLQDFPIRGRCNRCLCSRTCTNQPIRSNIRIL
jgi:hypothetical protein